MLGRIIGGLALAAALGACSTVRLAYNNLPEIAYWWLDGYVDFDDVQAPRVREALRELQAWHRREELPRLAGLLQEAEALAAADLRAEQVCQLFDALRPRLLAVAERAEPAAAALALTFDEAQLFHLARRYERNDAEFRKEWVEPNERQRLERRHERFVERAEDFYGRLDEAQRELLSRQVARSAFDPQALAAERRARQAETLALLRRMRTEQMTPGQARSALHAYVLRIADGVPGPEQARRLALQQEGCRNIAALHNTTSAAQREQAGRRLRAYRTDLQQLAAAP